MKLPKVVSRDEWTRARLDLLAREKAFDRERDALSARRRELPMVRVEKLYTFDSPAGPRTLRDLFGEHRQLILYHFMYDPSWDAGCENCSFVADSFDVPSIHLQARDTAFAAVSRASVAQIEAYKKRMGWSFLWVSSAGCDFNFDYSASFRSEADRRAYNYGTTYPGDDATDEVGLSCFLCDGDKVFHTYSTYARGIDHLIATYSYLDLTVIGRNEGGRKGIPWVRRHNEYSTTG
jgi:predicted dithiol-disulfide oxidoreductase (DUF899 family)